MLLIILQNLCLVYGVPANYVILGESDLADSVLGKISKIEAPLEKWAEIYERIPRKKEFSKIREIFISRMSQLAEK